MAVIIAHACPEFQRCEFGKIMQDALPVESELKAAFGDIPFVGADGMKMPFKALQKTHFLICKFHRERLYHKIPILCYDNTAHTPEQYQENARIKMYMTVPSLHSLQLIIFNLEQADRLPEIIYDRIHRYHTEYQL